MEGALFIAGYVLYVKATKAKDETGSIGLWAMVAFLVVVYCASVFTAPPSDTKVIAFVSQFQWLMVFWGYWVDQHRKPGVSKSLLG